MALALQQVGPVDPRRGHLDDDLAGSGDGIGHVRDLQGLWTAGTPDDDRAHAPNLAAAPTRGPAGRD